MIATTDQHVTWPDAAVLIALCLLFAVCVWRWFDD